MDAEFIQENAPERMAIKRELYARLDPVMPADTVLASSTSGLIMSEMQAGLRSAARFVVGHPFNPPHLIPLVEVVGWTRNVARDRRLVPGLLSAYRQASDPYPQGGARHLANRLQAALWREAVSAVVSGLASVEDVSGSL